MDVDNTFTTDYSYDALGRSKTVTEAGLTGIAYIADQTTITDPAGKKRVEFRDALGRLTQVTEDPGDDLKLNYVTT